MDLDRHDFSATEVEVVINNSTKHNVYINDEMTPTGVLLHKGTTTVNGDGFWIVAHDADPLIVEFSSSSHGQKVNRWCHETGRSNHYLLNKVGAACGLRRIRTLSEDGFARVVVNIKRG